MKSKFKTPENFLNNLSFKDKVNNNIAIVYSDNSVTNDSLNEIHYSAKNNRSSNNNGSSFDED